MNSTSPKNVPKTQAQRVFARFGGVPNLKRALDALAKHHNDPSMTRSIGAIYRWDLSRATNGSEGLIPAYAMRFVLMAARLEGIVLTEEDTYPGVR